MKAKFANMAGIDLDYHDILGIFCEMLGVPPIIPFRHLYLTHCTNECKSACRNLDNLDSPILFNLTTHKEKAGFRIDLKKSTI